MQLHCFQLWKVIKALCNRVKMLYFSCHQTVKWYGNEKSCFHKAMFPYLLQTKEQLCSKRLGAIKEWTLGPIYLFISRLLAFCSAPTLFGLHVKSLLNVQDKSIEIILTTHDDGLMHIVLWGCMFVVISCADEIYSMLSHILICVVWLSHGCKVQDTFPTWDNKSKL